MSILRMRMFAMCICCMSLVVRVMSDEVEKALTSAIEKLSTFA